MVDLEGEELWDRADGRMSAPSTPGAELWPPAAVLPWGLSHGIMALCSPHQQCGALHHLCSKHR